MEYSRGAYAHAVDLNSRAGPFGQQDNIRRKKEITCYRCAEPGHIAKLCQEIPNRQGYRTWRKVKTKANQMRGFDPHSAMLQDPNRDLGDSDIL